MTPATEAARARALLVPREVRQVDAIIDELDTLRPDAAPVLDSVIDRVQELIDGAGSGVYCPQRGRDGWSLLFHHWAGIGRENQVGRHFDGYLRDARNEWQPAYDMDRPEKAQRNRALRPFTLLDRGRLLESEMWTVVFRGGVGEHDQLRVLICDGPALLAWVGGFREEPFTVREQRRLSALVPALHRRLRVERRLRDADFYRAGLEAALEAIAAPAFIVRHNGSVVHANANGRAAYDADRALIARRADFEATPIAVRGAPDAVLLVKSAPCADLSVRVAAAARSWKLTRRQAEVLALMARGDANKLIASKLGCSLRTVEIHVTAVLRKAGCETRTEVVARLLVRR